MSFLLDHADGELAPQTGVTLPDNHRFDLYADKVNRRDQGWRA
jgi:hypothetical protein